MRSEARSSSSRGTALTSNGETIELPQRYNDVGEWKPLIVTVDEQTRQSIDAEIQALTKNPEIQGILKYIRYTKSPVLEFVIRTNLDICEVGRTIKTLGPDLHLYKCPKLENRKNAETFLIYDGWVELEFQTPEYIQQAIECVDTSLRLLFSYYRAPLEWRPKYGVNIGNVRDIHKPSEEGINFIGNWPSRLPTDKESLAAIESAISSYSRGLSSKDAFFKFVSFYIALEGLAVLISEGGTVFDIGIAKKNKTERRRDKTSCINHLHSELYGKDPIKFIEQGYFDCIQSLKTKTRNAVEKVFGKEHQYVKELFEIQHQGFTLLNIRNKIAHGDFAKSNTSIADLVWERMPLMMEISREFIFRVLFQLKPNENLPSYSGSVTSTRSLYSPNGLIASNLSMFPNHDWRIKPEWFDD